MMLMATEKGKDWLFLGIGVIIYKMELRFLRVTADTAIADLSHRSSQTDVCLSVRPSITQVDQSKTVQARITKSSLSAAWKTLVSGTVTFFHKFEGGHP